MWLPDIGGLIVFLVGTPARILGVCMMCLLGGVVLGVAGHAYLNKPPVVVCPPPGPPDFREKPLVLQTLRDAAPRLKSLEDRLELLRVECSKREPSIDGGVAAVPSGRSVSSTAPQALPCAEPAALDSLRRMHKSHLACIDQANACKSGIDQYEQTFENMAKAIGAESDSEKLRIKLVLSNVEQATSVIQKYYLDIPASIRADLGMVIDNSGRERSSIEAQLTKRRLLQNPEKSAYLMLARSLRVLQGLQQGLKVGLEPLSEVGKVTATFARQDRDNVDKTFAAAINTLSQAKAVPVPANPRSEPSDSSHLCQFARALEQVELPELQRSLASLVDDLARVPAQQSAATVGARP